MLQAILLTDCFEQLVDGSCPGEVLDHFECAAKALKEGGADPLAQQAHYEDALLIQQVGHRLCTLYLFSWKAAARFFGFAQVPLGLHNSMEAIQVDMSTVTLCSSGASHPVSFHCRVA